MLDIVLISLDGAELQLSAGELCAALEEVQGEERAGLGHKVVIREAHGGAALAQKPRVQRLETGGHLVLHAACDVPRCPPVNQVLHVGDVVCVETINTCADHPGNFLDLETKQLGLRTELSTRALKKRSPLYNIMGNSEIKSF